MAASSESFAKTPDDLQRRAHPASDKLADKASEYAAMASEQIDDVVRSAEESARQMAEQGRKAGERVEQVATNFKSATEKSVRDQPMTTLAVAAAVGFVLGALWKS
ncbi:MAG: hypothetical protein R3D44_05000 [Hyphomicrobiaceae bacterium]